MPTLAKRLKDAMGTKITQADLARACHVSRAAVTKWMSSNTNDLKMAHLFAAARLCGVDPEWLALGTGSMRAPLSVAESGASYAADGIEPRHRALLQAYRSLPKDTRFAVRMLIETLAGSMNPDLQQFMANLEEHNRRRDTVGRSVAETSQRGLAKVKAGKTK